ncbi:MAG TPA: T9SS type A sorting domain-containing protein, partial [Candidatus Cloacimonadota bacterium]|nr:T9SS type A sorting domain-containing protein [Candidatus Cloacimonadota bacterium]
PEAPKEIHMYQVPPAELYYSRLDFDYNLIPGGFSSINKPGYLSVLIWGDHNLNQEPGFMSTELSDPFFLHLSPASPCVDAGAPDISMLGLPPYDLAGNQRVWNGRIDMGVFECDSQPWVSNNDQVAPAIPETNITAYPNPFSRFTNIKVISLDSQGVGAQRIDRADITIYNIKGQRVKSISLDPAKTSEQITYWDGRDADNIRCASGIYFINLIVNGQRISSKKVTYIR